MIRLETIVKGRDSALHYTCGRCALVWAEQEMPANADRRRGITIRRRGVPRGERRGS
jgi:hypothetical protein